jgi:hypothetical protein
MSYRYVQGIDYGPRKGTLGLSLHMAEGGDGTLGFLAQHPGETRTQWIERVNGVSANAVLLSTGEVVQMLGWDRASGNLNPSDRAGEYGYYGHHYLVDVLGDHWPDPNTWTISMEIAGFRAEGPTDAQVKGAIAWAADMKRRFPTLRGATGHHDQSPKPCPGLTANMKAIFEGVGGHGLWTEEAKPVLDYTHIDGQPDSGPGTVTIVGSGHSAILADGTLFPLGAGTEKHSYGLVKFKDGKWAGLDAYLIGQDCGWLLKKDVSYVADAPPSCDDAIGAELERAADRAHAAVLTNG